MAFGYRCPECRRSFKWDPLEGMPRYCAFSDCKFDMGEPPDDNVIALPAFLSAKGKSVDDTARALMDSSNHRAEQAAQMLGTSVSDMSDMKVTDLRSTKHEGEIAAVPVVNEVTRQMDMLAARGAPVGFGAGATAVEHSAAVRSGEHPNMGAKMRSMIHRSNGMVSDRPALETLQPGYIPRA